MSREIIPEDKRTEIIKAAEDFTSFLVSYRLQKASRKSITQGDLDEYFSSVLEKAAAHIYFPTNPVEPWKSDPTKEDVLEYLREKSIEESYQYTLDTHLENKIYHYVDEAINRQLSTNRRK